MVKSDTSNNIISPFLRWTGSKRWFIKDYIDSYLPTKFSNYHEPFLGGGAVFFHLKSGSKNKKRKYYLSDSNEDLINCYIQLRDNVNAVMSYLKLYKNTEEEYYRIRATNPKPLAKKAARFIYLNRTSFNGIYRVNCYGEYNVPYGHRTVVDVVTNSLFDQVSSFLQDVSIEPYNFEKSIDLVKKNDLVFIDPPYTVAHENNGFIEYNQKLFSWDDQIKLKEYIEKIITKGAYFILTNASHKSIRNLYSKVGEIDTLSRISKVGGRNKTRGIFNELIVSNTNS